MKEGRKEGVLGIIFSSKSSRIHSIFTYFFLWTNEIPYVCNFVLFRLLMVGLMIEAESPLVSPSASSSSPSRRKLSTQRRSSSNGSLIFHTSPPPAIRVGSMSDDDNSQNTPTGSENDSPKHPGIVFLSSKIGGACIYRQLFCLLFFFRFLHSLSVCKNRVPKSWFSFERWN